MSQRADSRSSRGLHDLAAGVCAGVVGTAFGSLQICFLDIRTPVDVAHMVIVSVPLLRGADGIRILTLLGHPLDTVKVRLQTQGVIKTYSGMFDCLFKMARHEGVRKQISFPFHYFFLNFGENMKIAVTVLGTNRYLTRSRTLFHTSAWDASLIFISSCPLCFVE